MWKRGIRLNDQGLSRRADFLDHVLSTSDDQPRGTLSVITWIKGLGSLVSDLGRSAIIVLP